MESCRRCHDFSWDEDLKKQIDRHIDNIDSEIRVAPELYSKRLAACEQCEIMRNGMCGYCGCFVLVRAAKIHNTCPKPYNDLWNYGKASLT